MDVFWQEITIIANSDFGKWLPISPFQKFIASWEGINVIRPYLGYVNWFIPIGQCLVFLTGWLVAIAFFYAIMAALRYLNIVD